MRVLFVTIGSRGDVQPYVALGRGLHASGYDVRVATHARFASLVTDNGLEFAPLSGDPTAALRTKAGQEFVEERESGLIRNTRRLLRVVASEAERCVADCNATASDVDIIVVSPLGLAVGHPVAEARKVPMMRAYYGPSGTPTGDAPALRIPGAKSLGRRGNRMSYAVARQIMWSVIRPTMNGSCRRPLGLAPLSLRDPMTALDRQGAPILHGYSPAVIPRPLDWPKHAHVTGFWFLPSPPDWKPTPELEAFLEAGDPPVYVGFGSIPGFDDEQIRALVGAAVRRSGRRALLYDPTLVEASGGRPVPMSDDLLAIGETPFDRLLPRVAAVVQHGGAGTIASSLAAGVPTQVVPFLPDQRRWATRVVLLGAGPSPLAPEELDAERLAAAMLRMTSDQRMITFARHLGERIRQEDGVGAATRIIDAFAQGGAASPGCALSA
jgi:UDP:flavonoid glycosyltransferase YjiC (YdhE family)